MTPATTASAVLGFDCSTPATAVAVLTREGRLVQRRHDPAPGERPEHGTRLLGLIEAALDELPGGWEAVGSLAVGAGPGGFTGLRIALATARGLALGRGLGTTAVSSLRALGEGARADPAAGGAPALVAVIDARRGQAFAAAWRDGEELLAPVALGPEALARAVRALGPGALAVGNGALGFRDALERAGAVVPPAASALHRLCAGPLCRLAAEDPGPSCEPLVPVYLRPPDVDQTRAAPTT